MEKIVSYFLGDVSEYKLDMRKIVILIAGGVITLCANGFAFFNYMPKHDAINHMFFSAGEREVQLGRFVQPYYTYLRGNVVSPWLVGIIGTVFVILSVLVIMDVLDIKTTGMAVLASGFLVANLSITELCGVYLYIYDCCMIALLFSCLSVWCWLKVRYGWNIVFGAVCLALSMGFYQSYISVTLTLCAVLLLKQVMQNESWKEELYSLFSMVLTVGMGSVVYLLMYKLQLMLWHTTSTDGSNGMQRLTELSFGSIVTNIIDAYRNSLRFFITDSRYFGKVICVMHALLLMILVIGFLILLQQIKLKIYNTIIAGIIFITLPICCNFTSVLQGEGIVLRSSYALYLIFSICLMLIDNIDYVVIRKTLQYVAGVVCIFLIVRNVQYSNTSYVYARATYDRTVSIMTRVLEDIEEYEGYEVGSTPIAVIGEFSKNDNLAVYQEDRRFVNGNNKASNTYPMTTYNFWRALGSPIIGIDDSEVLNAYAEMDEVVEMPCYPYEGYCRMIGEVLVVKIADRK